MAASLTAYGVLWIGKFLIFNRLFRYVHVRTYEGATVGFVEPRSGQQIQAVPATPRAVYSPSP